MFVSIFLRADAEHSKEEMEPEQCNAMHKSTACQERRRGGGNCSLESSSSDRTSLEKLERQSQVL